MSIIFELLACLGALLMVTFVVAAGTWVALMSLAAPDVSLWKAAKVTWKGRR